jgi:hypothetical protein
MTPLGTASEPSRRGIAAITAKAMFDVRLAPDRSSRLIPIPLLRWAAIVVDVDDR